ncbi:glycosyltransferase family 2 protein [Candidatus Gottesmanbacteria bacterium]|nr:glycosyltransferase family 2 protein [Candidatus Gottesmanbacteria bacterium]
MTKKLSIIIINYNSGLYLKKCLLSIRGSRINKNKYEVIIVDNNSKDMSIAQALTVQDINLLLIKNHKNEGFAKANNKGIEKSRAEYILLLNPDTLLNPEILDVIIAFMDKNKKVAISTCRVDLPNGQIDDACHRGFPTPLNALFHFSGLADIFPKSTFFNGYHLGYKNMDVIHEIDSCVGAFMMIRRTVGEKIGWLDEDYFWYGEDIDFCYRVKEKGYKVVYLPHIRIIHFKGIASGIKNHSYNLSTANKDTKQLATKARFEVMRIFYEKHYKHKYSSWITYLVFAAIKLKEYLNLRKYN